MRVGTLVFVSLRTATPRLATPDSSGAASGLH